MISAVRKEKNDVRERIRSREHLIKISKSKVDVAGLCSIVYHEESFSNEDCLNPLIVTRVKMHLNGLPIGQAKG